MPSPLTKVTCSYVILSRHCVPCPPFFISLLYLLRYNRFLFVLQIVRLPIYDIYHFRLVLLCFVRSRSISCSFFLSSCPWGSIIILFPFLLLWFQFVVFLRFLGLPATHPLCVFDLWNNSEKSLQASSPKS